MSLVATRAFAVAQAPAQTAPSPAAPIVLPAAAQGGTVMDVITLHAFVGGTPLRFGNIVPGSEHVELNGRPLTSGADYAIDYDAGVVYLTAPQVSGDSLIVSYRTGAKSAGTSTPTGLGLNGMQYSFFPGAKAVFGLGLTDRADDGTVTTSNLYGWQNALKFGGGSSLSGMFMVADQQRPQIQSGFGPSVPAAPGSSSSGKGQFLAETFKTGLMGGSMSLDYQNVSTNFANFSALRASGYSDADVQRYKSERGLTREGLSFNGLKVGGLAFSDSFKSVDDGDSRILQTSAGIQQGAFALHFNTQKVDQAFHRFTDLSDADKAQLQKEQGMSRQDLGGQFSSAVGKLSFSTQSVSDDIAHSAIHKTDVSFAGKKYGFDYGTEDVGAGFARVGSLTAAETAQWGHEVGFKRQWLSFNAALDAKDKPFAFNQVEISGSSGNLTERDAAYTGKSWSLQHVDVKSSAGFTGLGALPDAQTTAALQRIASTYGDKVVASPADKASFLANPGVGRDYTSLTWAFSKKWSAKFDLDHFTGAKDSGSVRDFAMTGPSLSAGFKSQVFGPQFTEAAMLMPMEQTRLGTLPGLKRQDYSFSDQFNKVTKLQFAGMNADSPSGGAHRLSLDFAGQGIQVTGIDRGVDSGFAAASQLIDPEASVLGALAGFRQSDWKWSLTRFKNMTFTGESQDARDAITGETRGLTTANFSWNVDRNTQFSYADSAQRDQSPLQAAFDVEAQKFSLLHNFGRYGKFEYRHEDDIDQAVGSVIPDSHSDYVSYETQLNKGTSVKAEETLTRYANGQQEDISAETVSTQLTKRAGVSLTEVQVSGNDQTVDPAKNNYGVWYDLGNGVRISYGYAHQLQNGADTVSSNLTVAKNPTAPTSSQYSTLQAGAFGPVSFAGGYGTSQYTNLAAGPSHTQAFSNFALKNDKPLRFGPVSDIKFNLGMDTAADFGTWSKDNHSAGVSAQFAKTILSFDYKGQLATQGLEGIDRGYRFQTVQSPKNWLNANILYKVRTLPNNQSYIIRDFNVSAKPSKQLEFSDLLQTNPEIANTNVFLGSVPQAARSQKLSLDYHQGTDTTFGASYQELINTANDARTTTQGVNLKLFQKSGSPVTLFYGEEDDLGPAIPHRLANRYTVQFDQKPGPHQTFSLFLGNVSYDYNPLPGFRSQNWTARMDYAIHF